MRRSGVYNFLYFVHQVNYISHVELCQQTLFRYVQNICVCAAVDVTHNRNRALLCLSLRMHLPTSPAGWYLYLRRCGRRKWEGVALVLCGSHSAVLSIHVTSRQRATNHDKSEVAIWFGYEKTLG